MQWTATIARHNTQYCGSVETYLFYGYDRPRVLLVIYKRETLSVVTLEWSEVMRTDNTPDIIVCVGHEIKNKTRSKLSILVLSKYVM